MMFLMSFASEFDEKREEFAAHYSQMSTGELLKIASQPWALSDEAWEALEDELDRRGLDFPEPEAQARIPSPEKRDLVMLRRFRDIPEALLAKGRLDASGIECFLADDNMVRMDWFISNLLGGVKLLVEAEDFTRATSILNEPIPNKLDVEGVGEYKQPRCPQCGSLDTAFAELEKTLSYTSAWLGLPLPLQRKDWRCRDCGCCWPDPAAEDTGA
jgi:hypothetical protein